MGGYREVMYLAGKKESRSYVTLHPCAKLDKRGLKLDKIGPA